MAVADYVPECCQFSLLPHFLLFGLLVASVAPFKWNKWQIHARIVFHQVFGLLLFLAPGVISAPKVGRPLDAIHLFLQRFSGTFQIGFAYYFFKTRHDKFRPEPAVTLAKAVAAVLIFCNEFYHANRYVPAVERGLHFDSPKFYFALVFVELAYAVTEIFSLAVFYRNTSTPEEIDIQCKRTQRLLEGRGSVRAQFIFWLDAVFSILYAVSSIASTDYLYLNVIEHGIQLDNLHRLYTAEFGYYALASAIISLLASQFTVYHQKIFVEQRIIVQALIFLLHAYGSYAIYPFAQVVPHFVALISLAPLYQLKREVDDIGLFPEDLPDENGGVVTTRNFRTTKVIKTT